MVECPTPKLGHEGDIRTFDPCWVLDGITLLISIFFFFCEKPKSTQMLKIHIYCNQKTSNKCLEIRTAFVVLRLDVGDPQQVPVPVS